MRFSVLNGLPDNGVRAIAENDDGDLLIGTRYGGLAVLSKDDFKVITRNDGLFSNAIWSIDPKYDSLKDFIFNFRTYANEVCETKNIKLFIETKEIENVKVNSQIKRSLQLVSKEALNNALKYSGCSIIKYSLVVENKGINLSIEDNGAGFDPEKVKYGHGLFNMDKNAKELSGSFKCEPIPGKGTKILIKFPIHK